MEISNIIFNKPKKIYGRSCLKNINIEFSGKVIITGFRLFENRDLLELEFPDNFYILSDEFLHDIKRACFKEYLDKYRKISNNI